MDSKSVTAEELFGERCATPHNIDQHLPTIRDIASRVRHITEMGVDRGWSTSAFLASGAETIHSYDIVRQPEVDLLEEVAAAEGIDWRFQIADSRTVEIEDTDLLFIDTDHTYEQMAAELDHLLPSVRWFLMFHDVTEFPDMTRAILERCPREEWTVVLWEEKQHGLLVLVRNRQLGG